LQQELAGPQLQLLLCGPVDAQDAQRLADLEKQFWGVVSTARLTRDESRGVLVDVNGEALRRLGVNDAARYLVRPDGHVAFRCGGGQGVRWCVGGEAVIGPRRFGALIEGPCRKDPRDDHPGSAVTNFPFQEVEVEYERVLVRILGAAAVTRLCAYPRRAPAAEV